MRLLIAVCIKCLRSIMGLSNLVNEKPVNIESYNNTIRNKPLYISYKKYVDETELNEMKASTCLLYFLLYIVKRGFFGPACLEISSLVFIILYSEIT